MYGQSILAEQRRLLALYYEPCVVCGRRATHVPWAGRFTCKRHNY